MKIFQYVKSTIAFTKDIFYGRELLWELTKADFQKRYLGSYLGILWAFIQPLLTVIIFWFVFQIGFKSKPVENFPFILWFVTGLFPWYYIADSISNSTGSVSENSYLVKNVLFRVSLLPIIKLISAFIIHLFFIGLLFIMYIFYGFKPTIYMIQVVYYLFAASCLLLGIAWLTSALAIFLKDMTQIISVGLQFGFWGTPIFWSYQMLPEDYWLLLEANPAFYIIEGYRNSFIYQKWFWETPAVTLYFWSVTGFIVFCGAVAFKKLRPHFADVL